MASQSTSRGVPFPSNTDANDVPGDLEELAQWVNANPGVAVLTTTQRNALAGPDLWDGRIIFNLTTVRLERFKDSTDTWVTILDGLDLPAAQLAGLIARANLGAGGTGEGKRALFDDQVYRLVAPLPQTQVFDASGTWTKPAGCTRVRLRMVSGGNGGGFDASGGTRGAGGSYVEATLPAAAFGATASVVVGAGGAGSSTPFGSSGGNSSVATTAYGTISALPSVNSAGDSRGRVAINGVTYGNVETGGYDDVDLPGVITMRGDARSNGNPSSGPGFGGGGGGNDGLGNLSRGQHASGALRLGGAAGTASVPAGAAGPNPDGRPGAAGDIANGICGSGGGGGHPNNNTGNGGTGGVGGKYGGGGGGAGSGKSGGAGGQGGVAITAYFD